MFQLKDFPVGSTVIYVRMSGEMEIVRYRQCKVLGIDSHFIKIEDFDYDRKPYDIEIKVDRILNQSHPIYMLPKFLVDSARGIKLKNLTPEQNLMTILLTNNPELNQVLQIIADYEPGPNY